MVSLRAKRSGVEKSGALHELHTQQIALDTSIPACPELVEWLVEWVPVGVTNGFANRLGITQILTMEILSG
jgi:hypothetical protein